MPTREKSDKPIDSLRPDSEKLRCPKYSQYFLLLIIVQAAHSIEEYFFGLYEVFPPAHFVSGLISTDLHVGFIALTMGARARAARAVRRIGPDGASWRRYFRADARL